ncbi:hypothetical protein vseg_007743 [Gypsophila vaccaria]
MGCSASRFDTLIAKTLEHPSSSSSSSSSSTMAPKTLNAPLVVHHPALQLGDSHHLVSLTSSTYGSLIINSNNYKNIDKNGENDDSFNDFNESNDEIDDFSVINSWELMEGLEDEEINEKDDNLMSKFSTLCDFETTQKNSAAKLVDLRVKSSNLSDFNVAQKIYPSKLGLNLSDGSKLGFSLSDSYVFVEMPERNEVDSNNSRPLWKHLSEESLLSKMDPSVVNAYDRALLGKKSIRSTSSSKGVVSKATLCEDNKIVLYFTSLRGIRKTYEDCSSVRMTLRGFRVVVDERDISMDSSYRKELESLMVGEAVTLPQLFVKGKRVGGADEVRVLHESGELERIFEGFPKMDGGFVCRGCGDARFVPCSSCSGSRKVFWEKEGRTRRCLDCNENGLIRCPGCCCS